MTGNNALEKILQQNKPAPVDEEIEDLDDITPDPDTYQAYSKGKQGGRRGELGMLLYFEDGETIEVLYYAFLMRVMAASPEILFLICSDCVFTIYGKHLTPLMSLLRDHKIIYLQAFNPQKHPPLTADNDEMVIETIFMQHPDQWWESYQEREAVREKEE